MTSQTGNAQDSRPLTGTIPGRPIHPHAPTGAREHSPVEALALRWFADMREGKINRNELAPEYDAHLTDHAVEQMSHYMKRYEFGHLPLEAHVIHTRKGETQTFHVVKIHFPRGDAASVLMGFNQEGKITGVTLTSMAGD
ncbi:MAG: hypothetical protein JO012_18265 [Hyphomicrobiales bacterium]|nr:hypothetical protein [Hyphomicrobiales bacterium]